MSGFIVLLKNELMKQLKKTSIKIILVIVLFSSFFTPSILNYINTRTSSSDYKEFYENQITYIDYSLNDIKDKSTDKDNVRRVNLEAEKEKWKLLIDNNISTNDWRSESSENWLNKTREVIVLEGILQGYDKTDIMNSYYGKDISKMETYFHLPREEVKKVLERVKKEQTILMSYIVNNNYLSFNEDNLYLLNNQIKNEKEQIIKLENQIKENPNDEDSLSLLKYMKQKLNKNQELQIVAKYRVDEKIIPNESDWRNITIKDIEELIERKSEEILNEKEFNDKFAYDISMGLTYDKYKQNLKKKIEDAKVAIEINWYSLNNNIPQLRFSNDARNLVDVIYMKYISVVAIICIIIAGSIVSVEHSKGTIRLLLIRPVYRWKILLSKLISVFIIGYGTLIATVLLTIISSGLIFRFSSFNINILSYRNGAIIEQSYIISILFKILFASISLIFIISLAFCISTLSQNTTLSVAIPTVIFLSNIPTTLFMVSFNMKWVSKTILPFINLSIFHKNSYYVDLFKRQYEINLDPNMGAVQLMVISIILLFISFVVFNKKDVIN